MLFVRLDYLIEPHALTVYFWKCSSIVAYTEVLEVPIDSLDDSLPLHACRKSTTIKLSWLWWSWKNLWACLYQLWTDQCPTIVEEMHQRKQHTTCNTESDHRKLAKDICLWNKGTEFAARNSQDSWKTQHAHAVDTMYSPLQICCPIHFDEAESLSRDMIAYNIWIMICPSLVSHTAIGLLLVYYSPCLPISMLAATTQKINCGPGIIPGIMLIQQLLNCTCW